MCNAKVSDSIRTTTTQRHNVLCCYLINWITNKAATTDNTARTFDVNNRRAYDFQPIAVIFAIITARLPAKFVCSLWLVLVANTRVVSNTMTNTTRLHYHYSNLIVIDESVSPSSRSLLSNGVILTRTRCFSEVIQLNECYPNVRRDSRITYDLIRSQQYRLSALADYAKLAADLTQARKSAFRWYTAEQAGKRQPSCL